MDFPSDSDLLTDLACRGYAPAQVAEESFSVLYARHGLYLYSWLRRVYSKSLSHNDIEDIYQMTFARVWERAETYDDRREGFRPWLCAIAKNLAADFFRTSRGKEVTLHEEIWATLSRKAGIEVSEPDDPVIVALAEGLDKLKEKEQDLLLATAHFYDRDIAAKDQRMPRDILAQIADRWGTTPTNLRKVRERALEKLRKHLLEKGITIETVRALRGGRDV